MEQITDIEQEKQDLLDYLEHFKKEFLEKEGTITIHDEYPKGHIKRLFITLGDDYDLGSFVTRVNKYKLEKLKIINTQLSKGFIFYEPVTIQKISCAHPKVKNIWETGSLAAMPNNSLTVVNIHIILHDGVLKQFTDVDYKKAIEQAEGFLKTL